MATRKQRAWLKTFAVCLGIVVTVKFAPFAIMAAFALSGAFWGDPWLRNATTAALWPLLGVSGLVGFWLWAFAKRPASSTKRIVLSLLIGIGVAVVAPFVFLGGVLTVVAAMGMLAGIAAITELWLPERA